MNVKYYVPFETAKLLKEKGYPQLDNEHHYNLNGDMVIFSDAYEGYAEDTLIRIAQDFYTAPTYHEVVDWLEEKGIYLHCYSPTRVQDIGQYTAGVFNSNTNDWGTCKSVYPTREEALNAAILKALEMI